MASTASSPVSQIAGVPVVRILGQALCAYRNLCQKVDEDRGPVQEDDVDVRRRATITDFVYQRHLP